MGPYCKFCGSRCFVPTTEDDYVTRDLKATCKEGVEYDMNVSFPRVVDTKGDSLGWLTRLNKEESKGFSEIVSNYQGKLLPWEVKTSQLSVAGENKFTLK